jgi:predicted N-acetyltransferase YhbS
VHIRDVTADDAAAIREINREALGYEFPLEDTRAQLERIVKVPNIVLLVAVDGEEVLGYIQLSDYENTYHRPLKNLITLATSPRHQRRGVGRRLLEAGEEWARGRCVRGAAGDRAEPGGRTEVLRCQRVRGAQGAD